jgi:hypothetical protein
VAVGDGYLEACRFSVHGTRSDPDSFSIECVCECAMTETNQSFVEWWYRSLIRSAVHAAKLEVGTIFPASLLQDAPVGETWAVSTLMEEAPNWTQSMEHERLSATSQTILGDVRE